MLIGLEFNLLTSLPNPNQEIVSVRNVEGGIVVVIKFSGKPIEDVFSQKG